MEEITMTFKHTSLEESELLIAGGVDPDTADMMFEVLTNKTNLYMGYDKAQAETYPNFYKPCWSEGKLRRMIADYGQRGMVRGDVDRLIPILLSWKTMKEYQEYKEKKLDKHG